ncbi:Short-chain dehydrogenase [Heracleum sosnowskyi]|uniref:Short-chain dehydrogenase n=1 Tax=Heracleum sosnowskyi TaxID=360622 RepID=A0AAD8IGT3_9APIA|nr:Short-chain dehydrogenase [Heracleum sosnowskyi]
MVQLEGGASRIGLETARVLALRKAHVIIAARNVEAANEAKAKQLILKDQENARIENNRSIQCCPYQLSEDGIEIQFATNHLELLKLVTPLIWKNVPQGAATTCYVALHPKLKGVSGKYYQDCNEWQPRKFATDEKLAKKLWDFSKEP